MPETWREKLDERERKEVEFSEWLYNFSVGDLDAAMIGEVEREVIVLMALRLDALSQMPKPRRRDWRTWLEEEKEEATAIVPVAQEYAANYHHGTAGHNLLMLIAKMALLLDDAERE